MQNRIHRLSFVAVLGVSLISFFLVLPTLARPSLGTDELITLQNYTWLGTNSDGSLRRIESYNDIEDRGPISGQRLLIGVYCSLGRWSEPNNHVVNSFLVNLSLLIPCDALTAIRIPALLSGIMFGLVSGLLALRCGLVSTAPLVTLLCIFNSYTLHYSAECRGYTLMLALCVLLVHLLLIHTTSPFTRFIRSTSIVVVACASFENIVSLSVDWVIPLLIAATIFPSKCFGITKPKDRDPEWVWSHLSMLAVVIAVGGTFLIDRLPYVYSSARQYGIAPASIGELGLYVRACIEMCFPDLTMVAIAFVGFVGCFLSARSMKTRALVVPWIVAFAVSLLHFGLAKKLPYVRNMGYLFPPFLFGFGVFVEFVLGRIHFRPWKHLFSLGVWVLVLTSVLSSLNLHWVATTRNDPPRHFTCLEGLLGSDSLDVFGIGVSEPVALALPKVSRVEPEKGGAPRRQVLIVEKTAIPFKLSGGNDPASVSLNSWPDTVTLQENGYSFRIMNCRELSSLDSPRRNCFCILRPSFESVSVTDENIIKAIEQERIPFYVHRTRYQAKLDVFSKVDWVLLDLSDHVNEFRESVDRLKDRFGGTVSYLLPASEFGNSNKE